MKNYVIKRTRVKSSNPKYLNQVRYFSGHIDLGALGQSEHWSHESDAQLQNKNEAEGLHQMFTRADKIGNYTFEIITK